MTRAGNDSLFLILRKLCFIIILFDFFFTELHIPHKIG